MNDNAIKEMIADWFGASRAYKGKWPDVNNWSWLENNKSKFRLHKDTWEILNKVLKEIGYKDNLGE